MKPTFPRTTHGKQTAGPGNETHIYLGTHTFPQCLKVSGAKDNNLMTLVANHRVS